MITHQHSVHHDHCPTCLPSNTTVGQYFHVGHVLIGHYTRHHYTESVTWRVVSQSGSAYVTQRWTNVEPTFSLCDSNRPKSCATALLSWSGTDVCCPDTRIHTGTPIYTHTHSTRTPLVSLQTVLRYSRSKMRSRDHPVYIHIETHL